MLIASLTQAQGTSDGNSTAIKTAAGKHSKDNRFLFPRTGQTYSLSASVTPANLSTCRSKAQQVSPNLCSLGVRVTGARPMTAPVCLFWVSRCPAMVQGKPSRLALEQATPGLGNKKPDDLSAIGRDIAGSGMSHSASAPEKTPDQSLNVSCLDPACCECLTLAHTCQGWVFTILQSPSGAPV